MRELETDHTIRCTDGTVGKVRMASMKPSCVRTVSEVARKIVALQGDAVATNLEVGGDFTAGLGADLERT
jgi:hypothetical protein